MNNGYWEDQKLPNMISYRQALAWLLWHDKLLWLDGRRHISPAAVAIASLFGRTHEELRHDVKEAHERQNTHATA